MNSSLLSRARTARNLEKLFLMAFLARSALVTPAEATLRTWIAGSGNWSNGSNWSPAGQPQNGDDLVFNNSAGASMDNDLPALSVRTLEFHHSGAIEGFSLTVTVGINAFSSDDGPLVMNIPILDLGGDISIDANDGTGWGYELDCDTRLNGHTLTCYAANSGSTTFAAPILGAGQVVFASGTNYIVPKDGSAGPALIRVSAGYLGLGIEGTGVAAITSQLEIDAGATAFLTTDSAISTSATVTLLGGGQLLLSGHTDAIGSLVLTNYLSDTLPCTVDASGQGLLGLSGSITSWNDSGSVVPVIKGRVSLNGFIPMFTGGAAYAGLDLPVALGSGGGFSKAGNSALLLHGNSTFTGGVEVDQGILDVNHVNALGATSGGVLLAGSGSLTLRTSISGESLSVNGNQQLTTETAGSLLTAFGTSALAWSGPIILNTNLVVIGGDIAFTGPISGPGGIDFRNTGTAKLAGPSGNLYSGTTLVRCFLLEFNKPSGVNAYAGPLVAGGGSGGPFEARWLNSYQNVGATATLYANGIININNFTEDFGPVTFNGGELDTGTGSFNIYAPLTVNPAPTSAVINGYLGLPPGDNRIFIVGDGATDCDLLVNAVVFGSPGTYLVKQGPGTMCLANANTFDAPTLLEQGILDINNSSGLGSWPGLVIFDGATLRLSGAGTGAGFEAIGAGVGGTHGAIEVLPNSSFTFSGGMLLDGPTTFNVGQSGGLGLNGAISSSGAGCSTIKTGAGVLTFSGATANSYSGDTILSSGQCYLSKSSGQLAVPGNLIIGPGAAGPITFARLLQSGGIGGNVTVNANSLLDLNGFVLTLNQLSLNDGGSVQTGSGTLEFFSGGSIMVGSQSIFGSHASSSITGIIGLPANAALTFNVNPYAPFFPFASGPELEVTGVIPRPTELVGFAPAGIVKNGLGRMRLSGNNTYAGLSSINDGTLVVNGTQPKSAVTVNRGTLGGSGTVGPIYMNGSSAVVAPGDSGPGILTCSNLNAGISASGILLVELNGTTPGSGYDQLNVRGTVNLAGVGLQTQLGFTAPTGAQFDIISNDGNDAVIGIFNGLQDGGRLYIGGVLYQINYIFSGRPGNDVALQGLDTPPPPMLLIEKISPASIRLLWPINDPPFSLQMTTNLPATDWVAALPLPTVIGTNNVVTNSVAGAQNFYRLVNP